MVKKRHVRKRTKGERKGVGNLQFKVGIDPIHSKTKERDSLIKEFAITQHPKLYRMTTSNDFIESHEKGVYTLENDFTTLELGKTKIEGKSFTSDQNVLEVFYGTKGEELMGEMDINNFQIIVMVRENALIEDQPISLANIEEQKLLSNEVLVNHLYNPYDWNDNRKQEYLIDQFGKYAELSEEDIQELKEKGVKEKDIQEAIELSKEIITLKNENEKFEEYLADIEAFEEEPEEPYPLNEAISDLVDNIPYLLRVEGALEVSNSESEIITIKPTKISYDDLIVIADSEDDKKILVDQIPLLESHIEVVDIWKMINGEVEIDFE